MTALKKQTPRKNSESTHLNEFDKHLLELAKNLDLKKREDLDSELDKITDAICRITKVDRSSIWLYGENNQSIKCQSIYIKSENKHDRGLELFQKDFDGYFVALEEERIIEAHNAHTHHATKCFSESYLKPLGIESMYDTPIWKADEVIGVLCLEYLSPKDNWTIEEKNFLTSAADFIAKVFEKSSVLEQIETLELRVEERTQDLTNALQKLKSTQKQLVESEKMASLATLLSGVAHELKNPLNLIVAGSDVLNDIASSDTMRQEEVKEVAEIITEASKRLSKITSDMIAHSLDSMNSDEIKINLKQMIPGIVDLFKSTYCDDYNFKPSIIMELEEDFYILASHSKIDKAFTNIIENSFKSMKKKMEKQDLYTPEFKISGTSSGGRLHLEIFDNGLGIEEEVLKHVFEPFYTTQGAGQGTGLGLYQVYDIIKKHGGNIEISSDLGNYVKIDIELPILSK